MSMHEDGIPMADWIRLAERLTGKAYTFSQQEIAAAKPVRFLGTVSVTRDGFFEFFQTMMYIHGFALVPRQGDTEVVEIVSLVNGKRS